MWRARTLARTHARAHTHTQVRGFVELFNGTNSSVHYTAVVARRGAPGRLLYHPAALDPVAAADIRDLEGPQARPPNRTTRFAF